MNATTQLEMVNVNAKKNHVLGNQQPSSFQLEKVQRLTVTGVDLKEDRNGGGPVLCSICGDYKIRKAIEKNRKPILMTSEKYPHIKDACPMCYHQAYMKEYRKETDVRKRKVDTDRGYRERNAEKLKELSKTYNKNYREKNADKVIASQKAFKASKPERHNEIKAQWKKRNPAKVASDAAYRRMLQRFAVPLWVDKTHMDMIDELYELANKYSIETGVPFEVDHIIPLRGKNVTGLHVISNLCVIPAFDNRVKGNRIKI